MSENLVDSAKPKKFFGLKKKFLEKKSNYFSMVPKKSSPACYIEQNAVKLPSVLINRANQSVYLQILTKQ